MPLSRITDAVSEELSAIIMAKDHWAEEEKSHIHGEFMKIFGEVWSDVVTKYHNSSINSANQCTKMPANEEHAAPLGEAEDEETLEAEVRHEATLIAVTKRRTKYPAQLAALLGKTKRLQKNTTEVMKVNLPPKLPLEVADMRHSDENIAKFAEDTSESLSKSCHSLQIHTDRLTRIAEAAETIINNQQHPIEALLSSAETL